MPVYGIATAEPKIQPTKVMVVNQGSNPGSIASSISNLVTTSGLTLASSTYNHSPSNTIQK